MKLSSFMVAMAMAGVAEASKPSGMDSKKIQESIEKIGAKTLLRRARKLEQADEGEEQDAADGDAQDEFRITSDYSIQFKGCQSLKVLDTDALDGYVNESLENGYSPDFSSFEMHKDFIIFDAKSLSGSKTQYVVDLPTFVSTLAETTPEHFDSYCTACADAVDTCFPQDNNNGQRKLATSLYIDCKTCQANGCYTALENGEQYVTYTDNNGFTSTDALAWLQSVSQCHQISQDNGYNNLNNYYTLYAGLGCNAAGTGVEVGIFSDDTCTTPSKQTTFATLLSGEAKVATYLDMTKTLVQNAFTKSTSCANYEFVSPYEGNDQVDEDADGNAENYEDASDAQSEQANEACMTIFESAIDLSQSCNDGYNNYQFDANGNAWGTYTYPNGNYGSIYYDITSDADSEQVCNAIKKKNGYYSTIGVGSSTKLFDYSGRNYNTYKWLLADGSNILSKTSKPSSSGSGWNFNGSDFDWQGTKQQVGDTYNNIKDKSTEIYGNVSEKVGNGINRAAETSGLEVEEIIMIIFGVITGLCMFTFCSCYCCRRSRDEKSVNLIGKERKQWKARDHFRTTHNRKTWA